MSRTEYDEFHNKERCTDFRSKVISRLDAASLVSLLVVFAATAALPTHARLAWLFSELLFAASSVMRFRRHKHVSARTIPGGHFCSTTCLCPNPPLEDLITRPHGSFLKPPCDRQLHQQHQHQHQKLYQQHVRQYTKPRSFPQLVLRLFHLRWPSAWASQGSDRSSTGTVAGARFDEAYTEGKLRNVSDWPFDCLSNQHMSDEQLAVQTAREEGTASVVLLDGYQGGFGATTAIDAPPASSEPRSRTTGPELQAPGAARSEMLTMDQQCGLISSLEESTSGTGLEAPHRCTTAHTEAPPRSITSDTLQQWFSHRNLDLDATDPAARAELLLTKLLDPKEGHLDLLQGGHFLAQWFHGLAGPHQLHVTHIAQLLSYLLLPPPSSPPLPRHSTFSMHRAPCHRWPAALLYYLKRGFPSIPPASPPPAACIGPPCASDFSSAFGSPATAASPPHTVPFSPRPGDKGCQSNIAAESNPTCTISSACPGRVASACNEQGQQRQELGCMTWPTGAAAITITTNKNTATTTTNNNKNNNNTTATTASSSSNNNDDDSTALVSAQPRRTLVLSATSASLSASTGTAPTSVSAASAALPSLRGSRSLCGSNNPNLQALALRFIEAIDLQLRPAPESLNTIASQDYACSHRPAGGCCPPSNNSNRAEKRGESAALDASSSTTDDGGYSWGFISTSHCFPGITPVAAAAAAAAAPTSAAVTSAVAPTAPSYAAGIPRGRRTESTSVAAVLEGRGSARPLPKMEATTSDPMTARTALQAPLTETLKSNSTGAVAVVGGWRLTPAFCWGLAVHIWHVGRLRRRSRVRYAAGSGSGTAWDNPQDSAPSPSPAKRPLGFSPGLRRFTAVELQGGSLVGGPVDSRTQYPTPADLGNGNSNSSSKDSGYSSFGLINDSSTSRSGLELSNGCGASSCNSHSHVRLLAATTDPLIPSYRPLSFYLVTEAVAGVTYLALVGLMGFRVAGVTHGGTATVYEWRPRPCGRTVAAAALPPCVSALPGEGCAEEALHLAAGATVLPAGSAPGAQWSSRPVTIQDTYGNSSVASIAGLDNQESCSNSQCNSNGENIDDDTPLVFLHGIGLGLTPYLRLLRRLVLASGGRRAVYAVQYKHVSMRLTATIPAPHEVAADVATFLAGRGVSRVSLLAHSYGTLVASALTKLAVAAHPSAPRVHHLTLVDPVCFAMFLPHLVRNAIYQQPLPDQLNTHHQQQHNYHNHHHHEHEQHSSPWCRRRFEGPQEVTASGSHQPQDLHRQLRECNHHALCDPGPERTHTRPQRIVRRCALMQELGQDTSCRNGTAAVVGTEGAAKTTAAVAAEAKAIQAAEAETSEAIAPPVTDGGMAGPWAEARCRKSQCGASDGSLNGSAACVGATAGVDTTAQGKRGRKPRHGPGAALRHQLGGNLLRGLVVGEFHCAVALRRRLDWARVNLWPSELPPQSTVVLGGRDNLVPAREVRQILANRAALLGSSCSHPAVLFREDLGHGAFLTDEDCQAQVIAAALGLGLRQQGAQTSVKRNPLPQAPKSPLPTPHRQDLHRRHHHQQQESQTRQQQEQDEGEKEQQQQHGCQEDKVEEGSGLEITGRCGDERDACYSSYSSKPLQGAPGDGEVDSYSGGADAHKETGYSGYARQWLGLQRLRSTTCAGKPAPCWPLWPQGLLLQVPKLAAAQAANPTETGTTPTSLDPRVPSGWLGRLIKSNARPVSVELQGDMTVGGQVDKQPYHCHKAEVMAGDKSADPNGVTWSSPGQNREEAVEDTQLWNKIGSDDAHRSEMREKHACQQEQEQTGGSASSAWPPSCYNHQLAEIHKCNDNLMNYVRASCEDSVNGGGGGIGRTFEGLGDRKRPLPSYPFSRPTAHSQWVAGLWRRP